MVSLPYATNEQHAFSNNPNNNNNSSNNNNNGMNNGEHKSNPSSGKSIKTDRDRDESILNQQILQNVNQSWQTLASSNPTSTTVDYSSHILSATLPISIQHFLKYSETIKKETNTTTNGTVNDIHLNNANSVVIQQVAHSNNEIAIPTTTATTTGKKKKKKSQRAPKVRAVRVSGIKCGL